MIKKEQVLNHSPNIWVGVDWWMVLKIWVHGIADKSEERYKHSCYSISMSSQRPPIWTINQLSSQLWQELPTRSARSPWELWSHPSLRNELCVGNSALGYEPLKEWDVKIQSLSGRFLEHVELGLWSELVMITNQNQVLRCSTHARQNMSFQNFSRLFHDQNLWWQYWHGKSSCDVSVFTHSCKRKLDCTFGFSAVTSSWFIATPVVVIPTTAAFSRALVLTSSWMPFALLWHAL